MKEHEHPCFHPPLKCLQQPGWVGLKPGAWNTWISNLGGKEYLGCHLGGSQMLCITQESTGSGDRTQTQALSSCPRHWLNSLYMCRWPLHYWFEYPWWLMMMSIFNILTICVSFWVEMSIFWVVSFYCWVATVLCTCSNLWVIFFHVLVTILWNTKVKNVRKSYLFFFEP